MKQYISRFLKSVSLFYMGFPIVYILTVMLLFDVPASDCARVLLSPSFYIVSALAVTVGYGFWEMKRWTWYLFVFVNVLIAYQTAVVASDYGESHHKGLAFLFSLGMLALVTFRVAREVRVPYFFPRIRWWESDPRHRLSVKVTVSRQNGEILAADILDLSMGGCFVKLRNELSQDEKVNLKFTVFEIPINCEGSVVWRTNSTVTHPKGVGIKFAEGNRGDKRSLRLVNMRLKKIASFYKKSRYLLNQEEFLKKLQELESAPAPTSKRNRAV